MPRKQVSRFARFLKTTAIGGLLFLLPLIVLGAIVGQVVPIVVAIAQALGEILPFKTPAGIAVLVALAIAIVLLLCFAAGLFARRSFGRRISRWFERNIALLFPRYAILKDQMAGTLRDDENKPKLRPILVRLDDMSRIAFEVSRDDESDQVTVYLPGSPDPWSGSVAFIAADRIEPLDIEFSDATSICEQLGRNLSEFLKADDPS